MTSVGTTSQIVIFLQLFLCFRAQYVNINKKPLIILKFPQKPKLLSTNVTKSCNNSEMDCFFTHLPHSGKGPLGVNFHEKHRRHLSLLSNNLHSPVLNLKGHQTRTSIPAVLYGKISDQNVHPEQYSQNPDSDQFYSIISSKVNNTLAHGSGKINNAGFSNKMNLLHSIKNNPFVYEIIKKSNTNFYVSTIAPDFYLHRNETVTTTKSINVTPESQNQEWNSHMYNNYVVMTKFLQSLDGFERKFYEVTFTKLSAISPLERRRNGISFIQSGLFLYLTLMALSSQADPDTRQEIEECIGLKLSNMEKKYIINELVSTLPSSNEALKFRLSTRLVLGRTQNIKQQFQYGLAPALQLHINRINTTDPAEALTTALNKMVEEDSGGAMRDTFDEDELSEGICAVLLTTMYIRARWRSAPTVLNGTHVFHDDSDAPPQSTRMIRINDIMRYAELSEWDAEAIEIFYATPGLSLLMIIPRGRSLRDLSAHLANTSIHRVLERMYKLRVAVTLPLYTLRMTLLLREKLQSMGVSRVVNIENEGCKELKLSHAIQRLMFWAEAGRNAFKDDGIEWDEIPALELVVNRPYIFFVRWRNITIMNGHFVL